MLPMSVTSDVSKAVPEVMDAAFAYPANRPKQFSGARTPPLPAMYRSYAGACPVTHARTRPLPSSETSHASSGASVTVSRNVMEATFFRKMPDWNTRRSSEAISSSMGSDRIRLIVPVAGTVSDAEIVSGIETVSGVETAGRSRWLPYASRYPRKAAKHRHRAARTQISAPFRFLGLCSFVWAAKRPVFKSLVFGLLVFKVLVSSFWLLPWKLLFPLYVLPEVDSFVRTASSVSAGMDTSTFSPARRC